MNQTRNLDIAADHLETSETESGMLIGKTQVQQPFERKETKGLDLDPFSWIAKRPQKLEQASSDGTSRDAQWRAFRSARGDLEVRWLLRHRNRF